MMSDKSSPSEPADLPVVATDLRTGDPAVRLAAVRRLVHAKDAPRSGESGQDINARLDLLVEAMGDDDFIVRKEAVAAILTTPDAMLTTEWLVRALGEPDNVGRRNAAIEGLVRLGPVATLPLLREFATVPEHRKVLVDVLSALSDPRAVPALCQALSDENANVRAAAAEGLGGMTGMAGAQEFAAVVPALISACTDREQLVVLAALEGLNRHGVALPFDRLLPLLDRMVLRPAVLLSLGLCGDLRALPLLCAGLLDRARGAREAAFSGLLALHQRLCSPADREQIEAALSGTSEAAVRSMIRALLEAGPRARRAVATVLGWTGHKDTVRPLVLALTDTHEGVAEAAGDALLRLPDSVEVLCNLLPEMEAHTRAAIFAFFARSGPALCQRLQKREGKALLHRVQALLCDGLQDRDETAAGEAARALLAVGGKIPE